MVFSCVACRSNENAEKYCSSCSKGISQNDSFCSHCGVEINVESNTCNQTTLISKIESSSQKSSTSTPAQKPSSNKVIVVTSTQSIQPSSSSNTEEFERQLFQQLYNNQKTLYVLDISNQIDLLNNKLKEIQALSSENNANYLKDKRLLTEQFTNMGLLNSGTYKNALNNLEQNYNSKAIAYSTEINKLQNEITALRKEKNNPSYVNILERLAENNDMTYAQALEKYNKYIKS